ncbi:GFA family protein [Xanthobacter sp.]|uniref:GFA family protein n=1 Tax=Xanthobacter sp. TaxID=35809 RepID=UPI0025E31E97|nr:GFA family protein [Xanthobacter sp.]
MAEDATNLEGGCLCGRMRYRLERVKSAYWCHCTMCRRASGSAALPWVSVAREDVTFLSGTPAVFESSPGVARRFCGNCGSPIVFDMVRESDVDVTIGTLDDPDRVTPTHHIWFSSALHMAEDLGEGLPHYDGERPSDS